MLISSVRSYLKIVWYHITNFISNKYATGSISQLGVAESSVPNTVGYNIVASYLPAGSTLPVTSATPIPASYIAFDYKTGVLSINDYSTIPSTNSGEGITVYVTAYQYVGKTLNRTIQDLETSIANAGGGGGGGSFISSSNGTTIVSASNNTVTIKIWNSNKAHSSSKEIPNILEFISPESVLYKANF